MSNTMIINIFNSDCRNINNIKTQHHQIMSNITDRILKIKPMIKKPIEKRYAFFTGIAFSRINFFA